MRNTTLETEKQELNTHIRSLKRQRFWSIIFGMFGLFIIFVANFPDAAEMLFSDKTVLTNLVTVVVTVAVVRWVS